MLFFWFYLFVFVIFVKMYQSYPSLDSLLDTQTANQPDIGLVGVAVAWTAPPIVTRLHYNQGLQVKNDVHRCVVI